jgi:CDP-6-deoxy-D-xylo-4-hexulose-3-dehydrase
VFYELAADTWGADEINALQEVITSRRFTMGPKCAAFEEAFAEYHGKAHAVMLNSGSSANLVAVAAFCYRQKQPLQRGDEVLVPAVSWSTTYAPFQQYGLRLKLVDIELETLNIDPDALEAAIGPRTRAVAAVSILGNPAPLDRIYDLCQQHGLALLEDNCESLGARLGGRLTGTFGDIGTFSFFFSHQISTAEGGMVITDDRELADLCRTFRAHGWTRDLGPGSPIFQPRQDDFFEAYRFLFPGYNLRPTEFAGAVGIVQMDRLGQMLDQRRRNLALFQSLFADDPRFLVQRENGASSSFSFTIVLNPDLPMERSDVLPHLDQGDIAYRIITGGCFTRHDAIRHFDHEIAGSLTNAEIAHDRGFFVGNAPADLSPQLNHLRDTLDAACR